MIAETNRKQKLYILICVAISILLHLLLLILNLFFEHKVPTFQKIAAPIQQKSNPIMMMQQPPNPPMHRIHRAGTGEQAPRTEKALSMGQPSAPMTPPMPAQTTPPSQHERTSAEKKAEKAPAKKNKPQKQTRTFTSPTGRVPIQQFFQDAIDEDNTPEQDTKELKKALYFLSPQHLYETMRKQAVETPSSSGGVAEQFGNTKYLHYNRKVYEGLQQAMNLIVSRLSQAQYKMTIDQIQHPTRIRFALDQNGKLLGLTIVLSSGNRAYDAMASQIVQDASYPPIPKSFNMHTTYHTYGIVLFYDGPPRDDMGVSPYLEGE